MMSGVATGRVAGLTRRQAEFKAYVQGYVDECGIPPTYSEIAAALRLSSKSSVHRLAQALSDRGHLRIKKGMARSIVLAEPPAVVPAPPPVRPVSAALPCEVLPSRPNRLPDAWLNEPVTVRLPPKLNATLQALARRARIAPDEIVIEALEGYVLEQPD